MEFLDNQGNSVIYHKWIRRIKWTLVFNSTFIIKNVRGPFRNWLLKNLFGARLDIALRPGSCPWAQIRISDFTCPVWGSAAYTLYFSHYKEPEHEQTRYKTDGGYFRFDETCMTNLNSRFLKNWKFFFLYRLYQDSTVTGKFNWSLVYANIVFFTAEFIFGT